MQAIIEFVPLLLFFIVYKVADIYWATGVLIATSLIHLIWLLVLRKPITTRQWVLLGLIIFFGSLTLVFHNDAFIKWKVTVIYATFSIALLFSDLVLGKNILKQVLGESFDLPANIWRRFNLSWAVFFAFLAGLNIYVAYNFPLEDWVNFKVFGLTIMTIGFTVLSILMIYKHIPQDDNATSNSQEK